MDGTKLGSLRNYVYKIIGYSGAVGGTSLSFASVSDALMDMYHYNSVIGAADRLGILLGLGAAAIGYTFLRGQYKTEKEEKMKELTYKIDKIGNFILSAYKDKRESSSDAMKKFLKYSYLAGYPFYRFAGGVIGFGLGAELSAVFTRGALFEVVNNMPVSANNVVGASIGLYLLFVGVAAFKDYFVKKRLDSYISDRVSANSEKIEKRLKQ